MFKTCKVELDPITVKLAESFDYQFTGESRFEIPEFVPPSDFNIGLIVGNSGSGKTSLLERCFKIPEEPVWNPNKSIASHFNNLTEACEKLFATGLSSIPALCRPYHVLSNGEKYRAHVARILDNNVAIDEYSSVVDRNVAKGISVAMSKYIKKKNLKNVVISSCHRDIIEWLEPDWCFDINFDKLDINGFSLEKFPKLGQFNIG